MYQEHYEAMLKLKERLAQTENERDVLRTKLKDARRVAEAGADMSTMVENTWFRRIIAIIDDGSSG